ncbi:MAG: CoA transferase [Chloroflexi bacterium]|nr:CoA transferase [Chloroflexota bacterium]
MNNARALSHLKVVELSGRIAVAFCTKVLADFGAEVIKVEPRVAGAPERRLGPFKDNRTSANGGGLHLFLNTNKKSVTLDPATETGARILKRLLGDADAFVEGTAPGSLAPWGLDAQALEAALPHLLVTSISDFGQSGPYRDYQASDLVHWAMSCMLVSSGLPDREPVRVGDDLSEYVAGLHACATTICCLFGRHALHGQSVDLSVLESFITMMPSNALMYAYHKTLAPRSGNRFPISIVECKDGYVGFYPQLQHQWESFAVLVGRPELTEDARFAMPAARLQHATEAMALIRPWFKKHTCEQAVRTGQELRVPIIKVASARDMVENPQFHARQFFADIGTEETGEVMAPGRPFALDQTPWQLAAPAPVLGQHNLEVYCNRLGFSKVDLTALSEQGVV